MNTARRRRGSPAPSRARTVKAGAAEEVCGTIEEVAFAAESGWSVLKVRTDDSALVTVCGTAVKASAGERIRCRGTWTQHPRYGAQLKAEQIETTPPVTADAIEKYLASGAIDGIGEHFARKLVNHFGEKLPEVIQSNPVFLESVQGIGPERRRRIADSWHKHSSVRDIMMFLHQHGVGPRRAAQIHRRYGDRAVSTLRENPYRLAQDIHGVGFQTADQIAQRLSIEREDDKRLDAGLRAVLQRLALEGHCAALESELIRRTTQLLDVSQDAVKGALERTIGARRLIHEHLGGQSLIFTPRLYSAEIAVAAHIRRLQRGAPPWGHLDIERRIGVAEKRAGKTLTASQREALRGVLESKFSIVTGGPGTGKTTIMRELVCVLNEILNVIYLCASTGRASRRLAKAAGREAMTLHRLLRGAPGAIEFGHHAGNLLDAQAVLVDESSMVDLELLCALLEALPDPAAVILIGDVDQLPSVGPGQVFYDLIESGAVAVYRLTENRRYSENSSVARNAHRVNRGLAPLVSAGPDEDFQWILENGAARISDRLIDLVSREIPQRHRLDPLRDIQVLSPMRRGELGTVLLNQRLQSVLVPQPAQRLAVGDMHFGVGDRVVQLVNDADAGVFNGDTGRLLRINEAGKTFFVDFDDEIVLEYEFDEIDEIVLAYLMSVHKAQGSEYPCVVIVLSTAHYPLLSKRLLYTAMTRSRLVYLLGEERAVHLALSSTRNEIRRTGLRERLQRAT